MPDLDRVGSRPLPRAAALAATIIFALSGSGAVAAETCSWTRTPSGADFGACADSGHKTYCVSCQFAPRVCVRAPC